MAELVADLLDSTRLLFDLQRANEIAQSFSGCLDPILIARRATDGLVQRFGCAFARIWLVETDQNALRLVASAGLYTRTDGSFSRVPMGAYKVGKIAQNRVAFLSNQLAEETWVKDRQWAIANHIQGFAGFPLTVGEHVIGVLAAFSHHALTPEFLEALQVLCTITSVALETALHYQQEKPVRLPTDPHSVLKQLALSDQLAAIFGSMRLTLIGTEQALSPAHNYLFLQTAEVLSRLDCRYCRLVYQTAFVGLEAIATIPDATLELHANGGRSQFGILFFMASCLGGQLQSEIIANQPVMQVALKLPYPHSNLGPRLQIRCRQSVLQLAFTHLAHAAGLQIGEGLQQDIPLLTDDPTQLHSAHRIMWLQQGHGPVPQGVHACVDLSITAAELRKAVEILERGETWGMTPTADATPILSEREREIMGLLTEGLRDRDIASQLIISESTVKFHINNVLSKLKARTRFQALHQAIKKGWL